MKALFLDRDGIVNVERGDYTWKRSHFDFTRNLFPFLRKVLSKGYVLVVITNQGGIDKGLYGKDEVDALHAWMLSELEKEGIAILDVFYCPHHSNFQKCICRKPDSELLEKAMAIYKINPKESVMIGDNERDVEAAEKVGIRGILMKSNPDWEKQKIEL